MENSPLILVLAQEQDTDQLAALMAAGLRAGDTLLLEGPIGAGKTHFARALIRARLGREEEVPSPTFTLVQTYGAAPEIWHADLYRLGHPDEVRELGLEEAFQTAICLVEWPERLGNLAPDAAIRLKLSLLGEGRRAEIDFGEREDLRASVLAGMAGWARTAACEAMLDEAGWRGAGRVGLAGDASARHYERLSLQGKSRVLMDAPPGQTEGVADFVRIARHLRGIGLSAPQIFAEDCEVGFLLLEDLGDATFAGLLESDPGRETELCLAASDVLLHLQAHQPPPGLADLSVAAWAKAALLVQDWYCLAITGQKPDSGDLETALTEALSRRADGPRVLILRDFHAENLMLLPGRKGVAQVGLLDFQLAQMGQPGYDLVSLLQDARRDVSRETEAAVLKHFAKAKGVSLDAFAPAYAVLGVQRALRILGIFARLCLVDGKARYLAMLPRVWEHLQRNLTRPELADLAGLCNELLPEPTPDRLNRIEAQCGTFR